MITWRTGLWSTVVVVLSVSAVWAEDGQADLDKATDLKLQAKSLRDFNEVIRLCESALKKGLDADSREFANDLLSATRFQKAERITEAIEQTRRGRQWKPLRRLALEDLDKILEIDKDYAEAYLLKARLLILPDGDPNKARAAIDEALKRLKDPRSQARAHLLRSRTFAKAEEARADADQAVKLDPNNVEARRLRAGLLLATKNVKEGIAELEKVLKQDPDDVGVRASLIEALMQTEQLDQALKHADEIVENPETEVLGHRVRAEVYLAREEYDEAISDINAVIKANPADLESLLLRGRLQYLKGDYAAAGKDIDRVMRAAPGAASALLLRSAISAAQGNYEEAIKALQQVQSQAPDDLSLQNQLAYYHLADDRPRKAIELFGKVLEQDPENASALRGRGDAYLAVGKHADAVTDFAQSIKHDPENAGTYNNLAWVLATSTEDKVRDGKRALELAKKACELTDYKQAHILSTLAAAHAELGDFEEARKWSAKAVELADKESEQLEQLKKELESYRQDKPWREKQDVKEKPLGEKKGEEKKKEKT